MWRCCCLTVIFFSYILTFVYATLTSPNGFFVDEFGEDGFTITVGGKKIVEHTPTKPFLQIGRGDTSFSNGKLNDLPGQQAALNYYKIFREQNEVHIILNDDKNNRVVLTLISDERNKLTIRFGDFPKEFDRIWVRLPAENSEHVYGGGLRLNSFDLRGHIIPMWSVDISTAGSDTSYPLFNFVSSRLYYCVISGFNYGLLDFTRSDFHELYVLGLPESINFNVDTDFERLARKLTYFQGRPPTLPSWFGNGLVIDSHGGITEIKKRVQLAKSYDIVIGGIFIKDWSNALSGSSSKGNDWLPNDSLYPDFKKEIINLKEQNIDVYGLVNPYFSKASSLFKEAQTFKYLVHSLQNETLIFSVDNSDSGIIDLTNQEAYEWFKGLLKDTILQLGLRGWFADLSIGAPPNAIYASGESGTNAHNQYPLLWSKVNRRACQEGDPYAAQTPFPFALPLETVFLTHAGAKDSARFSPLSFIGQTGSNFASLAATVRSILSLATSGGGISHFSIGWPSSAGLPLAESEDLFMRSAEFAIFNPFFKIEGNLASYPLSDKGYKLLSLFVKMHDSLQDYVQYFSQRFTREGVSIVRPLFFHYHNEKDSYLIENQFLYGRDLLVAPVLQSFITECRLYLPADKWVYIYDAMHVITGPQWITIRCPVGRIPVFYRQGSSWKEVFDNFSKIALEHSV